VKTGTQMENVVDPNSQIFGMPSCLRVPIAASDVGAIETYVRVVKDTIIARDEGLRQWTIDD